MKVVAFLAPLSILLSSLLQFAGDNALYADSSVLLPPLLALTAGYIVVWLGLRYWLGTVACNRICYWFAIIWLAHPLLFFVPLRHILGIAGIPISGLLGLVAMAAVVVLHRRLPYSASIMSALLCIGIGVSAFTAPQWLPILRAVPASPHYQSVERIVLPADAPAVKPHILYIVPDRYPSNTTLKQRFGYDNHSFTHALEQMGFHVGDHQYSNYGKTFLSLASTLNMNYLDPTFAAAEKSNSYLPVVQVMQNGQLLRILRKQGYRYLHMGGWWEPTKHNPYADNTLSASDRLHEFTSIYLVMTPLSPFGTMHTSMNSTCARTQKQARLAQATLQQEEPQFIFWHIFSSHPPYTYDRDGECYDSPRDPQDWPEEKQMITAQLPPLNRMLLQVFEDIRKHASRPVIIVLQSDEGPMPWPVTENPAYNYLQLPPMDLRLKFSIINAVYLPSQDYRDFAAQSSPINNFRLVLRDIFDRDIPLLPQRHFSFQHEQKPYDMRDITETLQEESPANAPDAE